MIQLHAESSQAAPDSERERHLRRFIEQERHVTVAEVSRRFAVSLATARRDLGALARRGHVRRVRGGAVAVRQAPPELPVLLRSSAQADQKARIGAAAAALVADGDTVFLGSGTTALEVARHLAGRKGLTVLTNSLLVANALLEAPDVTVAVVGGVLRRSELSLIGHLAEQALKEVRASKVIIGIRAIHPEQGLWNDFLPETMTDRAILASGGQVIVVADGSKCGRVATSFVGPISAVHTLVTDGDAPDAFVEALVARQINVVRA